MIASGLFREDHTSFSRRPSTARGQNGESVVSLSLFIPCVPPKRSRRSIACHVSMDGLTDDRTGHKLRVNLFWALAEDQPSQRYLSTIRIDRKRQQSTQEKRRHGLPSWSLTDHMMASLIARICRFDAASTYHRLATASLRDIHKSLGSSSGTRTLHRSATALGLPQFYGKVSLRNGDCDWDRLREKTSESAAPAANCSRSSNSHSRIRSAQALTSLLWLMKVEPNSVMPRRVHANLQELH